MKLLSKEIKLWNFLNELRKQGVNFETITDVIQEMRSNDIQIGMNEIRLISSMYPFRHQGDWHILPDFVFNFIIDYFNTLSPNTILDPFAGIGIHLFELNKALNIKECTGIILYKNDYDVAKEIDVKNEINYLVGLDNINTIQRKYDAIFTFPPFGLSIRKLGEPPYGWATENLGFSDFQNMNIKDDNLEHLLLLKSSLLLEENGIGIFILSNKFTNKKNKNSVYNNLNKFNLYVDAILNIPSGSLSQTTISSTLVIISKKMRRDLFIGELANNDHHNKSLLNNLINRKSGKIPQLGHRLDYDSFNSWDYFITENEINNIARKLKSKKVPLKSVVFDVNLTKLKEADGFKEIPNSVYLPLLGTQNAESTKSELKIKAHNYAQIVLDPEKALSDYVSIFYSSQIGKKIRSLLSVGYIPKISKGRLLQSDIYLPTLGIQRKVVNTQSKITDKITQLNSLKSELWNFPENVDTIMFSLESFNEEDTLENWMKYLPFPLASILQAYIAELSSERKTRRLLLFYEALSQLNTIILMSGFHSNIEKAHELYERLNTSEFNFKERIEKPTFDTWINLGRFYGKHLRAMNQGETKKMVYELFAHPNDRFIEMISNKQLYTLLDEVKELRNEWTGHGALPSKKTWDGRETILESKLSQLQKLISTCYYGSILISPLESEYSEGIYNYKVMSLMGSNTLFNKIKMYTTIPLDKKRLYIIHENQTRPIELLPFIALHESPETEKNACYFYNKMDNGSSKWLSYHFDSKSEETNLNKNTLKSFFKSTFPIDKMM